MVDPLIFVSDALILSAKRGDFFYMSLGVFCFELVLGALYLLWLSTFTDLKKMSVKWLGGLYRICFFCDLFLTLWFCKYQIESTREYITNKVQILRQEPY